MFIYIDLLLLVAAMVHVVTAQYMLAKYAPSHENYEPMKYSYAYDVKNPSTGDHKHHWENRNGDAVQGEYGLLDPDGYLRTVHYTSHPDRGFQAIVRRRHITPPYEHITTTTPTPTPPAPPRLYDNVRYALSVTHDAGQSRVEQASSTELLNHQRMQTKGDTVQNRIADNTKTHPKQIVKKNIAETEFALYGNESPQPRVHGNPGNGPTARVDVVPGQLNLVHIAPQTPQTQSQIRPNFYEPQNINSRPENYRQSLVPSDSSIPQYNTNNNFENLKRVGYVQTFIGEHPRIETQLQQVHGYQNNVRDIPIQGTQEIKLQNGDTADTRLDDTKLQHALSLINGQPHIKSQLELIHGSQSFPAQNVGRTMPIYTNTQNVNQNEKIYSVDYLTPNETLPSEEMYVNNAPNYNSYSAGQTLTDRSQPRLSNNQQQFNQQRGAVLSKQTKLPLILVNTQGKFGLPFYPTTKELVIPLSNGANFGYEGIPLTGSRRPGATTSTSETIYNAGDPTADREPEELVRQLNETCLYFRFNETTAGTEDGSRNNIFNAGDYTAQREEEELIRSTNVTCLNFTADVATNFASGFSLEQYCSQCLRNDSVTDEYSATSTYNENISNNYEQLTLQNQNNANEYIVNQEQKFIIQNQQPEPPRIVYPNYGYVNDANQNVGLPQMYIINPLGLSYTHT